MSNGLTNRIAAGGGLAYFVLAIVGNSMTNSGSPMPNEPRAKMAEWVAGFTPHTIDWVGGYLELVAMLAFIVFAGSLWSVFRRAEGEHGPLSAIVFGAALVAVTVKISSAPSVIEVYQRSKEGFDPQLSAALIDMNSFAFLLTWAIYAVILGASAALILRTRVLPRWLGWVAAVLSPALLVTVAAPYTIPPFAFLLALAWVAAVSIVLVVRRREPAPQTAGSALAGAGW